MQMMNPETKSRFPRRALLLLPALLLLLVAGGVWWYWYNAGRLTFDGLLRENLTVLVAADSGAVTRIEVREGQRARQGQVLLRLDETPRQKALLEEQDKLSRLEALIPPQYLRVPAQQGVQGGESEEALAERLERQRGEEAAAERRFQEASDREAQASVIYSRAAMLAAKKSIAPEALAAAEQSLAAARHEKEQARRAFETQSLSRAATGTDIRRMRDAQASAGADTMPLETRLSLYRQQQSRVAMAASALAAAVVLAPENGMVSALLVEPGQQIKAGAPCLLFRPDSAAPTVTAKVPFDKGRRLKIGQPCQVHIFGEKEQELAGYVSYLRPAAAGTGVTEDGAAETGGQIPDSLLVTVAFPPADNPDGMPVAQHGQNAMASVTVLLREPLYAVPASQPQAPPLSGQGAPAGEAMPSASPQAAQTPAPKTPMPQTLGGPPSAQGHAPPALPPMRAPYPLTGSPLPDPQNNPSVVPQDVLDPPQSAPR